MSDNPPNHPQTPFQFPQVQYDEAGNPFFQDPSGRRYPCFGQFRAPQAPMVGQVHAPAHP
ncbi:hypothetical protein K443DRAFT_15985, partial [Laccaria amethystina LaAM-08-1]